MASFLLELFSEEIPARFQEPAAVQLKEMAEKWVKENDLSFDRISTFVTPRRLILDIRGLPHLQGDKIIEKKGPKVGAPQKALEGFLNSQGISLEECETRDIEGKGPFYYASYTKKGLPTPELLKIFIQHIIKDFSWPKSMRWGKSPRTWVRPLKSVLAIFEGEIVEVEIKEMGLVSSNKTHGHRFLAPTTISVRNFEEYKQKLQDAFVMIDPQDRKDIIEKKGKKIAQSKGGEFPDDKGLLNEVAGLVEWPVPLCGKIQESFLDLPKEVLITVMKVHQKYFSISRPAGGLLPYFILVSNIESADQGETIIHGNEQVLTARFSDAQFFWDQDRKKMLHEWREDLKTQIFNEKLGTLYEKTERMGKLINRLFENVSKEAHEAVMLAKADLATGMVGEFPELQGIMGGHYAAHEGRSSKVSKAIREHYAPLGPNDNCPKDPTSIQVALTDKIDTLVGFFSVGIMPTGSKDPFALRRTALGIIRLIEENELSVDLVSAIENAYACYGDIQGQLSLQETSQKTLSFMKDRLRVYFTGKGYRYDRVEAVLGDTWNGDVTAASHILSAFNAFLGTEAGQSLVLSYRRAANILQNQEGLSQEVNVSLLNHPQEKRLFQTFDGLRKDLNAIEGTGYERYVNVMEALSRLHEPLNAFFKEVTVMDEDLHKKQNRLALLRLIKDLKEEVANFSALEV